MIDFIGKNGGRATSKPVGGDFSRVAEMNYGNSETKMILQASSPDEIALVKYSNSLGMELVERDRTSV